MNDEGVDHTFTLERVVHPKSSPVNIMSTQRLSKLYPNGIGQPDKRGTEVTSVVEEYTLFWNRTKCTKTFHTADSGLPGYLFNTG